MNDKNDHTAQDDSELEGFETLEQEFDGDENAAGAGEGIDDADFQDIADEIDTEVFGEEPPAEQAPKKKVNWFNIGVAVIAVAVAGGLVWSKLGPQLMGQGGEDMSSPPMAASGPTGGEMANAGTSKADSAAAAQQALQPNTRAVPSGSGMLDNPDKVAGLNQASPAGAQMINTAAGAVVDPFAALGDTPVAPQPPAANNGGLQSVAVPMPTPIAGGEPAPVAETTPTQANVAGSEVTPDPIAAAPVAPIQQAAVSAAPASEDNSGLKAQVSALEQKMEALDSKISAAVEQMSQGGQQAAAAPVDDARLNAIQSTLSRLEARLDDMSSKRAAAPTSVSTYDDSAPTPKKSSKKASKPKAVRGQTKWDEPYSAPQQTAVLDSPAPTPVVSTSKKTGGWELRGAQTGRAVIAKGTDMREVAIGETVPGLGEITGIATINGHWVVQGTQGRLSQ